MGPLGNILNRAFTIATQQLPALKAFAGKGDVSMANIMPSSSSASQANSGATSSMKTAFRNDAVSSLDSVEEAGIGIVEEGGVTGLLRILRKGPAERKEGGRSVDKEDEADSESIFNEVAGELSTDTEEGGTGGKRGDTGEEGAGAGSKGFGGDRTAGGQQMVDLLKNLDPNRSIQEQIDEYLTHPAWKTESGQAKVAQFVFDHLRANETALQTKVKLYVDKHTREAVLKALQREMAEKGVPPEQQAEIDKKFTQYFNLVSAETTTPKDEIDFMNGLSASLPELNNSGELTASFRKQLLHQIGLSMRKLSTFDDRAELMTCNMAIKTPRAINHLENDFAVALLRINKDLTQLALYANMNKDKQLHAKKTV